MFRKFLPLALLGLIATGCGKGKKVECEVTYDGKPLEGATVTFQPKDDKNKAATGITDSDGKCTLKTPDGKTGVMPGEYTVTVVKMKEKKVGPMKPGSPEAIKAMQEGAKGRESLIPAKYGDLKDSPLTATVPSGNYKFDLKK